MDELTSIQGNANRSSHSSSISKGLSQYLDKGGSAEFSVALKEDPWIPAGTPVNEPVPNGGNVKHAIVGGGFAGILGLSTCFKAF